MSSAVLFTDLDGTLIFSAKRKKPGDIVVEYKNGEEISCVSARQWELLPKLKNVVPVTTRSMEQYLRIRFPEGFAPKYAITDNGGNLLVDGAPDPEWAQWAKGITNECKDELAKMRSILEPDPDRNFELRMVDGLFLFTKSNNPEATLSRLGKSENCEAFHTGAKVYVIPRKLNKGAAAKMLLQRFLQQYFKGEVFCAGDSKMDIPLLNIADTALLPDDMHNSAITAPRVLSAPREGFSDFVTATFLSAQEV